MIFDCVMFNNELDMLECRLTEMQDYDVTHIIVEAFETHRGEKKPLWYATESGDRFKKWQHHIKNLIVGSHDLCGMAPWGREHYQRDAALMALAGDPDDLVLIADVDEIPSSAVLGWEGAGAAAVRMRVCIYAVDWEVPQEVLPPQCVVARHDWLAGKSLAAVRDARASYPVISDGGWHLSWLGGPEKQREKLETASCHSTEIDATPEGDLIRSGARWRTSQDGGGLPVVPVDVDETWPRYIYERRCPENWFRPRETV